MPITPNVNKTVGNEILSSAATFYEKKKKNPTNPTLRCRRNNGVIRKRKNLVITAHIDITIAILFLLRLNAIKYECASAALFSVVLIQNPVS